MLFFAEMRRGIDGYFVRISRSSGFCRQIGRRLIDRDVVALAFAVRHSLAAEPDQGRNRLGRLKRSGGDGGTVGKMRQIERCRRLRAFNH